MQQDPARRTRARGKDSHVRLDVLLVQRGLAPSRERAQALIMAGRIRVNGAAVSKSGTSVPLDATCELSELAPELRYASRGGLKLERALDAFALDPTGLVCMDVGASTGGFTDVLLRRGAQRVYAIDVGRGQLAWTLRTDPRVVVMDKTNVRYLNALPEHAQCAVIDVSFISLRLVLPAVTQLMGGPGWIVGLVKPQFEAGKAEADRGSGVISDPAIHRRVLAELREFAQFLPAPGASTFHLVPRGLIASPIAGREGNREYLLWLEWADGVSADSPVTDALIAETVREAFGTESPVHES